MRISTNNEYISDKRKGKSRICDLFFRLFASDSIFVGGFTMVEVVVMLAILTGISAMVLVNFGGLNEGTALTRSARELALNIRRAQNMSLAVTQIQVGSPPVSRIPPAVGIRLSTAAPTSYFLFADYDPTDFKCILPCTTEKIDNDIVFERNTKINRIVGPTRSYQTLHVIFAAPEATVYLTDENGTVIPDDKVDIELISPSGQQTKTVTVRVSGQVTVK